VPPNQSDLRNVLVAVSGQTPAIITETLWALERRFATKIDEIRIITTSQGRTMLRNHLLGSGGQFPRFCADYEIPSGRIAFSEKSIYVLKDAGGKDLDDIRSCEDNFCAANQVFNLINEWCKRKDECLLCSVAGGRKTLGIYLTVSLMMFGRPYDKLYHVLVTPAFETGVPDFFYPPPHERLYTRISKTGSGLITEEISSEKANVELAEIPFLRLREVIGQGIPLDREYTEAVAETQLLMDYLQSPPALILQLGTRAVKIGDFEFTLPRQLAAVYAYFLLGFNGLGAEGSMEALYEKRKLLADLERQIDRFRMAEMEAYSWEKMRDTDEFRDQIRPCISKVNKAIRQNLNSIPLASYYSISTGIKYAVNIQKFKVLGGKGKVWKALQ
jgi:CRISPR-associated protein (TIGR02584 family)